MQRDMIQTPIDSMSDVDYMSPLVHSFPREEVPSFIHSPVVYESFPSHASPVPQSPVAAMMIEQSRAPAPCPSLVYAPSEPASSLQSHVSHVDSLEAQLSRKLRHDCDMLGELHHASPGEFLCITDADLGAQALARLNWTHTARARILIALFGRPRVPTMSPSRRASQTEIPRPGRVRFPPNRPHLSCR
jgi:hypothetical protein